MNPGEVIQMPIWIESYETAGAKGFPRWCQSVCRTRQPLQQPVEPPGRQNFIMSLSLGNYLSKLIYNFAICDFPLYAVFNGTWVFWNSRSAEKLVIKDWDQECSKNTTLFSSWVLETNEESLVRCRSFDILKALSIKEVHDGFLRILGLSSLVKKL